MMTQKMMTNNNAENLFEDILRPFSDGSAGPYLRYDPVYDKIREARTEDDSRLSRGVWQIDLKKADHSEAEKQCTEVLTKRSKDFQILCWLAESWFLQYGLGGLLDGIELINSFAQKFWDIMHPLDTEHRQRLFEWLDEDLTKHLHIFPLTSTANSSKQYSLQDHILSKNFDQALRRDPVNSQKQIERANKRGDPLLPHVMGAFEQTPKSFFKDSFEKIKSIEVIIHNLKNLIDEKLGREAPSFSKILNTLTEIKRVIDVPEEVLMDKVDTETPNQASENTPENSVSQNESSQIIQLPNAVITSRSDAYKRLRELADIFATIEPHSPTANVLHKVSNWEQKQLVDILADFSKSPDAIAIFMNFISKE